MLSKDDLLSGRRGVFAADPWNGKGEQSRYIIDYLTKKRAYFLKEKKKEFGTRAIIPSGKEDIADIIFEQLSSQEPLEAEGVQKVKK